MFTGLLDSCYSSRATFDEKKRKGKRKEQLCNTLSGSNHVCRSCFRILLSGLRRHFYSRLFVGGGRKKKGVESYLYKGEKGELLAAAAAAGRMKWVAMFAFTPDAFNGRDRDYF